MAETINFGKFEPIKQGSETEKLKSILKRAVNSEQIPKNLKETLGKLIRKNEFRKQNNF